MVFAWQRDPLQPGALTPAGTEPTAISFV